MRQDLESHTPRPVSHPRCCLTARPRPVSRPMSCLTPKFCLTPHVLSHTHVLSHIPPTSCLTPHVTSHTPHPVSHVHPVSHPAHDLPHTPHPVSHPTSCLTTHILSNTSGQQRPTTAILRLTSISLPFGSPYLSRACYFYSKPKKPFSFNPPPQTEYQVRVTTLRCCSEPLISTKAVVLMRASRLSF